MRGDYQVNYPRRPEISSHLDGLATRHPDWAAEIAALPRDSFVNKIVGTHKLRAGEQNPRNARELASLDWWGRRYWSADPQQVDFVMLNRLAELVVRGNAAIHRALLLTYPYVFIDEFQDTTFAQYSFLRSVFGSGRTVVTAVGDSKQRIMGWAGARGNAFRKFKADFAATRFELNWNFRSAPTMTSAHHVVAKAFDTDVRPAASRVTATVQGNPLEIWHFADTRAEAQYVAQWIKNEAAKSGRSPDRYVLLARQKTAQLQPLLEEELARHGIRLRNDDGAVGELRLQDLLADELAHENARHFAARCHPRRQRRRLDTSLRPRHPDTRSLGRRRHGPTVASCARGLHSRPATMDARQPAQCSGHPARRRRCSRIPRRPGDPIGVPHSSPAGLPPSHDRRAHSKTPRGERELWQLE